MILIAFLEYLEVISSYCMLWTCTTWWFLTDCRCMFETIINKREEFMRIKFRKTQILYDVK